MLIHSHSFSFINPSFGFGPSLISPNTFASAALSISAQGSTSFWADNDAATNNEIATAIFVMTRMEVAAGTTATTEEHNATMALTASDRIPIVICIDVEPD